VILVVIAIVCIIKREALAKFLRSLKSEMGKIVWLPKNQTLKSTVVVLIIVAICAIVIGILDFAFGSGITFLGKLF
jgi:preprotein translocase SecE subunit